MSLKPITENTLFYGDNLPILREYIADESVDLIYLDPPFNSNRSYNVLFKDETGRESDAQLVAFDDTWHWGEAAAETYHALVNDASPNVGKMIGALRDFIGTNQMMAYLVMMAARLVELHRVLKPTGSLYLHCDPTASHYLKIVLDTIFGAENYRNEVIWRRTRGHNDRKITRYGAIHDTLFYYSKGSVWTFNRLYHERDENAPKTHDLYEHTDGKLYRKGDCLAPGGRGPRWEWNGYTENWRFTPDEAKRLESEGLIVYSRNGIPRVLRPVDLSRGTQLQDTWVDIDPPNSGSGEIMGYPTQKPLALLERIIQASSNPGDLVLDPFCGCGTAIAAAHKLARRWIGIDITHLAISLQKYRLESMFPGIKFRVIGEPEDIAAARQLAHDDRYQFQWWALSLIRAKPLGGQGDGKTGKKGSDKGVDGVITFLDDATGKPKQAIVQVKSGHVKSGDIRDLKGALEREKAALGLFITLEPPSADMETEAAAAGFYESPGWQRKYRRIQILTIEALLHGSQVNMPPTAQTFKQAPKAEPSQSGQMTFDGGTV
jgi:site-specific DNA-methyltransferase (adenine-specific)